VGEELLMLGRTLGRYRIDRKLGEGGMGKVYLAHDQRLPRDVAIKVLPAGALANETDRKRFRGEAFALSKLNHPNIAILHDFDTQDGIDFLVMEYVEGSTLKPLIGPGTMAEREIVRLAIQIAEGCAAAHDARIVHCDLKPANIMVSSNGLLKILDFGLAKLTRPILSTDSTDSTAQRHAVGGTLPYMAPEQLTGQGVDARTDIYALGNILYEMATGFLPFEEKVSAGLISDILTRAPLPPGQLRPDISSRLEDVILKCLEKDPENRYQSAKEVLVDLRRLSSASVPLLPPKWKISRHLRRLRIALAAAAICIAAVLVYFFLRADTDPLALPESNLVRVTKTTAVERQPVISPDGKWIAYTSNASGNADIYMVDVRGGTPIRLTDDPADDTEPAWYTYESALAFTSDREGAKSIYKLSIASRGVTLLVGNGEGPSLSPDDKRIAFCRSSSSASLRIWVAPVDAPSDAKIITGDGDGLWDHLSPSWSPDGTRVCYGNFQGLWIVPSTGSGRARQLTRDGYASEPKWSPDGRFIYFSSYMGGALAVYRVPAGGGKPQRVTTGSGTENHPDISRLGNVLCYSSGEASHESFILNRQSRQISALPALELEFMASIAPDSRRIVFPSELGRLAKTLWMAPLIEGRLTGVPYQLTNQPGIASHPAFSPDGHRIAYYLVHNNTRRIMIVSALGGQPVPITDGRTMDTDPAWSHDGTRLAFVSDDQGRQRIGIIGAADGTPALPPRWLDIKGLLPSWPSWSPDDKTIAFLGAQNGNSGMNRGADLWTMPSDGGAPPQSITQGAYGKCIRWDRATGDIFLSASYQTRSMLLYRISPANGMRETYQPLVEFGGRNSYGIFDCSGDGRFLVFSRNAHATGQILAQQAVKGHY